jgi:hypothetical protein
MAILEKKNSISVFKNMIVSELPEIIYSHGQIIILTQTATSLSQSLKILKEFLYLEGFIQEFNKFKLGHTLYNYNQNKPGFDFLGFFISQSLKVHNKNVKIENKNFVEIIHRPESKEILQKSKRDDFNLLRISKLSNIQTKTNKNIIITSVNPAKKEILIHLEKLKKIIKMSSSVNQEHLIIKLSSQIRIWAYYYNIRYNNKILHYCDYVIFKLLWRWSCRRHPKKNKKWIKYKYFHHINGKNWIFGIYKSDDFYLFSLPNHSDIRFLKPPPVK